MEDIFKYSKVISKCPEVSHLFTNWSYFKVLRGACYLSKIFYSLIGNDVVRIMKGSNPEILIAFLDKLKSKNDK